MQTEINLLKKIYLYFVAKKSFFVVKDFLFQLDFLYHFYRNDYCPMGTGTDTSG